LTTHLDPSIASINPCLVLRSDRLLNPSNDAAGVQHRELRPVGAQPGAWMKERRFHYRVLLSVKHESRPRRPELRWGRACGACHNSSSDEQLLGR